LHLIQQIGSIVAECTASCPDPTTEVAIDNQNFIDDPLANLTNLKDVPDDVWKRALLDTLVRQPGADPETVSVGQPQSYDGRLDDMGGNYIYDKSGGQNQIVYIVDSGADLTNQVRQYTDFWTIT